MNLIHLFRIFFVLGDPKLDAVFQVWSHECWVEWNCLVCVCCALFISHRKQSATFPVRTLLAHAQPSTSEDPQVLYSTAAPQPGSSQPILFPGLPLYKKDFAFVLGEFYTVPVGPYLQPRPPWMAICSQLSGVHFNLVCSGKPEQTEQSFLQDNGVKLNRYQNRPLQFYTFLPPPDKAQIH